MTNPTHELVYAYIVAFIRDRHYAPSQREISSACNVARSSVQGVLNSLERAGRIEQMPKVHRGIRVL